VNPKLVKNEVGSWSLEAGFLILKCFVKKFLDLQLPEVGVYEKILEYKRYIT